jgi:scyllo-inositol 2-dehydrogenase (NADP+)
VRVVTRIEDILQDPAIELVVVNTPEPTHYPYARQALLAGKHVVVEKAFTVTSQEADILVHLAQERGRILSVYHNRRWDSGSQTVRGLLNSGVLGHVVMFTSRYDRWRPIPQATWRETEAPGTDVLYNLGSHLIEEALSLFGTPEQVMADIRRERPGATAADAFDLTLYYPDFRATLHATYLMREPAPRYRILGTRGSYIKYGLDTQEEALKQGRLPGSPGWGEEPPAQWGVLYTDAAPQPIPAIPGNYLAYYDALYAAIRSGQTGYITGQEGAQVIRVIEAARRSAAEGVRVVMAER